MAHFLLQVAYTPQAWASLIKNPHDRTQVLKPVLEKLGGRFGSVYFAFGEYDIVGILDMPANADAAAFAIAANAGGAIKSIKTTPIPSSIVMSGVVLIDLMAPPALRSEEHTSELQ